MKRLFPENTTRAKNREYYVTNSLDNINSQNTFLKDNPQSDENTGNNAIQMLSLRSVLNELLRIT